jgi:hypothetical protein
MKGLRFVFFVLTALQLPGALLAAGQQLKITLTGGGLVQPIAITDPERMAKFSIGGGHGNGCWPETSPSCQAVLERSYSRSFIVDWSRGTISAPTGNLVNYEVEFLVERPDPNIYRVTYSYDPVKQEGFVYIPGRDDPRYAGNTWLILRGVEGSWYHAWGDWDAVVTALLKNAR